MECKEKTCNFCGAELYEIYYDEINEYYVCNICGKQCETMEEIRKYLRKLV